MQMRIDDTTGLALRKVSTSLRTRLPEIVTEANELIIANVQSYPLLVPADELAGSGRNIVDLVLGGLAGLPPGEQAIAQAVRTGRSRQMQGVALEDVLRAVRMDFVALWGKVVELAAVTPDPAAVCAVGMLRIWESLDRVMVALSEGYRYQETLVDRELLARRANAFTALAYAPVPDAIVLTRASDVLGFPVAARLLVMAGRLAEGAGYRLEMRWQSLGAPAYVGPLSEDAVGATIWSQQARRILDEMVAGQPRSAAVVAPPVEGLRALPGGISVARAALRGAPAGTVSDSEKLLVEALIADSSHVAGQLPAVVLGGVSSLSDAERERLLETLQGWLETDGGTGDVARHLRRHRNTVINHLRRVEELTHLSLTCPGDVATLVVALKALRLSS